MYRIGHGDCFLLAFDGRDKPVHVLIDCGYKPGSGKFIPDEQEGDSRKIPDNVVADIRRVTGGKLDIVVVTHEHQDHVNAITEKRFKDFKIGQAWFAWTESEGDKLAIALRKKHNDRLKILAAARARLAASDKELADQIGEFMALEIGTERVTRAGSQSLAATGSWTNKDAMKLVRERSAAAPRYIYPHKEIINLPGAEGVRVYALGPPHDEAAIGDLEPVGQEAFPRHELQAGSWPSSFAAALTSSARGRNTRPFSPRHSVKLAGNRLVGANGKLKQWYSRHYGSRDRDASTSDMVFDNAAFRRIGGDWLQSTERLALAMANDTNNSSLVLAFELGRGGKVLLFAGDAQRGNWASWAEKPFKDGARNIQVRDLLARTVLYKVGHHGSHNATLKGKASDESPNLGWLGRDGFSDEFTSMITAVRDWAMQPSIGWDHPLAAIKQALVEKCSGRVFQTDTDFATMKAPRGSSAHAWAAFKERASGCQLYFDYKIAPD